MSLLVSVVAGAGCAASIAWCSAHLSAGAAPVTVMLLSAGFGAFVVALVAVPLGAALDRELERIALEMAQAAENDEASPISTRGRFSELRDAAQRAIDRARSRADSAAAKLREAEIRRHLTEAELEHTEAVLNSLQDAVLVTDAFDELKMANEKAADLLGFDLESSIHQSINHLVADEALRTLIHEAHELGPAACRRNFDHELQGGADGSPAQGENEPRRHYEVTLASLPDHNREAGGVVTILRDVTQEREISQMKSEFVSKVSHELRTPLSSINAYIELLLDGEVADEQSRQEFHQIIKNESDRLSRLIDNMLNISRIEAGMVKIERSEVDFIAAAKTAVEVILPQAKLKNLAINPNLSPLACTAMADQDMVQQVLLNLLSNAVKYTPEGGRITLSVENDDATGSVMVTVADTGLGIPPDALPKVFDKFYRIENYKRVAKGTGLGLALVKHIVETVHHGQISVSSELGMGSKFTLTIPYDFDAS